MILLSQLKTRQELQGGRLERVLLDSLRQGEGHVLPQIFDGKSKRQMPLETFAPYTLKSQSIHVSG